MARHTRAANDMALDKLGLPVISNEDVLDVLRMWEFQSRKEHTNVCFNGNDFCLLF